MVDITEKARAGIRLINEGAYITLNRPHQYGKTTMLLVLEQMLHTTYYVISLSFEEAGKDNFVSERAFAGYLMRKIGKGLHMAGCPKELIELWQDRSCYGEPWGKLPFHFLSEKISRVCAASDRPIVLMIDEVDESLDYDVPRRFLDILRNLYLARQAGKGATFLSVILAGVTDVRNLRSIIRPDGEQRLYSPWNIAAEFSVDMSFSAGDIAGMLREYEADHRTGMDINRIASLLREYTSGYPFLVSRICKCIDEELVGSPGFETLSATWTEAGFLKAVRQILNDKSTLFFNIVNKLIHHPDLDSMVQGMLFQGKTVPYNAHNPIFHVGEMHGILCRQGENIVIANRIFESMLSKYYLSLDSTRR